jgi:DNA-binding CsgD family transcriptional regulator/DNA-binding transcriptional regulator YiaG
MVDWKSVNDRKKRAAVLRSIVGDDIDDATRSALETAEAAEEAARFVRQMREAAKLTQGALAEKLGISQPRISEIERGGTPEGISYAMLRRVARACGFEDWPVEPTARSGEGRETEPQAGAGLTQRQLEVLAGLKRGLSNKMIARDLQMPEMTVRVHIRHIMRKLGAANRTQAAILAATTDAAATPKAASKDALQKVLKAAPVTHRGAHKA